MGNRSKQISASLDVHACSSHQSSSTKLHLLPLSLQPPKLSQMPILHLLSVSLPATLCGSALYYVYQMGHPRHLSLCPSYPVQYQRLQKIKSLSQREGESYEDYHNLLPLLQTLR